MDANVNSTKSQMTDPIMQGEEEKKRYALINLDCLDSEEEIYQKIFNKPLPKTVVDNTTSVDLLDDDEILKIPSSYNLKEVSPPLNSLVILREVGRDSLEWKQAEMEGIYPQFFINRHRTVSSNFTCDKGRLIDDHQKGFDLLQKIIREGCGEDLNGIRWKIGRKSHKS